MRIKDKEHNNIFTQNVYLLKYFRAQVDVHKNIFKKKYLYLFFLILNPFEYLECLGPLVEKKVSTTMLHQITSQSYATHLNQWQTCSPSLSPSFSPSCLLISTRSSGPEDLIQLRNTGAETPHDSSRIWF